MQDDTKIQAMIDEYIQRPAPEPETVAICEACGQEMVTGDEAVMFDNAIFCSDYCLRKHLQRDGEAEIITIGERSIRWEVPDEWLSQNIKF